MNDLRHTIFALSSGRLPAAIAVVRISGPKSCFALETLTKRVPSPRVAALVSVRAPESGELIDRALALWFPAPNSETGEDTAELQLHGGPAVVAAVLGVLGGLPGLRLAEPGEFTRRAFENGRLDLTQVEALADLVYAETAAQRRQALQQANGLLGQRAENWRSRLIEASALIEAGIDFADEGDVPGDMAGRALTVVRALAAELAQALAGAARGERLRDGLRVAIAGPPNAGKSTLLNRLAQREAAIVSPYAGTTRDVIEVRLDLEGYPVNLFDTAGIRETSDDPVEREGMRRARAAAEQADLVLWVVDGAEKNEIDRDFPGARPFSGPETPLEAGAGERDFGPAFVPPENAGSRRWLVLNKFDLVGSTRQDALSGRFKNAYLVSAATGQGLDRLVFSLVQVAQGFFTREPALITRERQRAALDAVHRALMRAMEHIEGAAGEELAAEDLRHAATHLGRLTGRVDVEEVLNVIFREFCIGK